MMRSRRRRRSRRRKRRRNKAEIRIGGRKVSVTNPYQNVGGGTGVGSESRAGYWHECQDERD